MIELLILMLLFLLIGLPLLTVWLSSFVTLWAMRLAEGQRGSRASYPVAEMLEATFEPEPEGVWPPKPAVDPPAFL